MLTLIGLLLTLSLTDGAGHAAASRETLATVADKVIAGREEDFSLDRTQVTKFQTVKLWRLRGTPDRRDADIASTQRPFVEIRIFRFASEAGAQKELASSVRLASVSPAGSVQGLGDESYIWWDSASGFTSIRFRKANVMISLAASSRELAERFASHMLTAVDDRLTVAKKGMVEE